MRLLHGSAQSAAVDQDDDSPDPLRWRRRGLAQAWQFEWQFRKSATSRALRLAARTAGRICSSGVSNIDRYASDTQLLTLFSGSHSKRRRKEVNHVRAALRRRRYAADHLVYFRREPRTLVAAARHDPERRCRGTADNAVE